MLQDGLIFYIVKRNNKQQKKKKIYANSLTKTDSLAIIYKLIAEM